MPGWRCGLPTLWRRRFDRQTGRGAAAGRGERLAAGIGSRAGRGRGGGATAGLARAKKCTGTICKGADLTGRWPVSTMSTFSAPPHREHTSRARQSRDGGRSVGAPWRLAMVVVGARPLSAPAPPRAAARAEARAAYGGPPSKLTDAQKAEARRRRAEGTTLAEFARSYDVGKSTISRLA
jgi:hypothetical protein